MCNSCTDDQATEYKMTDGDIQSRHQAHAHPAITDACNLTISIDACFDEVPMYIDAIEDAVDMYNDLSYVGINVSIVSSNADIHITCYDIPCFGGEGIEGGWAGEFYDGDDESNNIYINTNMPEVFECCGDDFDLCEMTGLVVHEIGHALGLNHTNEPDGVYIPGTPKKDRRSIFNGGNFCESGCRFSPGDIAALRYLHPPCNCGVGPNFGFTYDGPTCLNEIEIFGIEDLLFSQDLTVVEWFVNDRLSIINSGSQFLEVKAIAAGPARVCATVVNQCGIETTDCFFFNISSLTDCEGGGNDDGPWPGLVPK